MQINAIVQERRSVSSPYQNRSQIEAIRKVYQAGKNAFGENYAQELAAKPAALRDISDLEWHMKRIRSPEHRAKRTHVLIQVNVA
ncbi:hypothetical protein [Pajaroellobacter abortibovis]|uniref:Uncharacterized protein n=1 Tax=Pajaroellobacter abortibovis TaxID=1882918 RepID=A0A1L6MYX6_9BACT|nr:hypothetical protein [Pajaroellobacter abortibovis]APS00743.1 hypothetical protein BCY86_08680 [Pajaroellobacter abortibovis]